MAYAVSLLERAGRVALSVLDSSWD